MITEMIRATGWEYEPRPIECPDGLNRLISLQPGYWHNFEYLVQERGLCPKAFTACCFEDAKDVVKVGDPRYPDLTSALICIFEYSLWAICHQLITKPLKGFANDNLAVHESNLKVYDLIEPLLRN